MKKLSTYLLTFFMIMFWGFRIILALADTTGRNIGISIPNANIEIILLFVTLVCIVLVIKRKLIGALLYLLIYGGYFGPVFIGQIINIATAQNELEINFYLEFLVTFVGLVIPIAVLFDMLLDKNRMAHPADKKTDWFYKNEEYDRKLDERADKNNYRTL